MAQKRLKSMIFPGLSDTYTVPQALSDLTDYSDFTDAQQDIVDLQTGLTAAEESVTTYVVGNTNTTGVQLDPGTYVWVKNHSVLTDGLYTVGSTAIVQGGSVVDTNMNAVSEGGLNDLKNTITDLNSSLTTLINARAKIVRLNVSANGTVTYTMTGNQWVFLAATRIWSSNGRQLTLISGYVTSSRSNYDEIVNGQNVFSISGSADNKTYTFTNLTNTDTTIFLLILGDW